jgi:alanine racemase
MRRHLKQLHHRLQRQYDVYNRIEVSRSALLHNLAFFRDQSGKDVIPVLKGNAYGHGIEQVAMALRGQKLRYIAVDGYFEALKIRTLTRRPILIMGMILPQNFPKIDRKGFTFVVQDEESIRALGRLQKRVKVHLELNTGMNRYGIRHQELTQYLHLLKTFPKLHLEGVMTHLADADGTTDKTVDEAVAQFDDAVDVILQNGFNPSVFHIGQSAGSLRVQSRHATVIRLGIGLYGINPFQPGHALYKTCQQLKPALRLVSRISKVHELSAGEKISYSYTYTAKEPMRVGVLPLGYHEGVNRALSNKGVVKAGQKYLPIVGRVCMNHTMVSLKDTSAAGGDEIVVYSNISSDKNSVDSTAAVHGLFAYSLLTDLSPDVRRYLVD